MTLEEIKKEKKNLEKEEEKLNKKYQELDKERRQINKRWRELEDAELDLQVKTPLNENKLYLFVEKEDYHYTPFRIFSITEFSKSFRFVKFIEYNFRVDDSDVAFHVEEVRLGYKSFLEKYSDIIEISDNEAMELILAAQKLDIKLVENIKGKIKKDRENNEEKA